jgi:LacI family transcriptional regulator
MANSKSGIRSIALQAGVSTATVSRVLNESGNVSKVTRDRVLSILEQSGYRVNAAAKALATRRTRTIAAVIPTLEHSIFAVFLNAIEDQLASAGYSLVIATHGFDRKAETRRCNEVLRLGAEGIILSGAEHDAHWISTLEATGVPCLFTSVHNPETKTPTYGYDNHALAGDALNYLAGLGHQSINVLHGPCHNNDRMQLRVNGIQQAACQLRHTNVILKEAPLHVAGGADAARHWIKNDKLPDACLCLADILALGVIFESHSHRIKIPDDLSVMGFEDLGWAANCSPSLTAIALPAAEMGRAAAQAMVQYLDNGIPMKHRLFRAGIIERESTREPMVCKGH